MTAVYLAAPYSCRDALRVHVDELATIGITVTSSWIGQTEKIDGGLVGSAPAVTDDVVAQHVRADFRDIRASDALVVFTAAKAARLVDSMFTSGHSGGRHVETGYALALKLPVIVVGDPENVFHRGACVVVPDWHAAVLELVRLHQSPRSA